MGLGDFNVEAENLVVADAQRADAGALALAFLHGGDNLAAVLAQVAQFVELGMAAAANDAGVAGLRRRVFGDYLLQARVNVGKVIHLRAQRH